MTHRQTNHSVILISQIETAVIKITHNIHGNCDSCFFSLILINDFFLMFKSIDLLSSTH